MKPVYTEDDEKRFTQVLKDIQLSIPKTLLKHAFMEKKMTPVAEKILQEAIQTESIDPEKRKQFQNILDTGQFSKIGKVENTNITKKIDQYVKREMAKAMKDGRLPSKRNMKYLPSLIRLANENKEANRGGENSA